MPLYEYRCQDCNQSFEVRQKFSDEPLVAHEACGGKVARVISAPGLHFKGSGFYITDYARSGAGKTEGKSDGKSEGKPDSKPSTETKTTTTEAKPAAASSPAKSE